MLTNILNYLAYGEDFLKLARKATSIKPLKQINAEQKTLIRFIVIAAVPLLLIILGLFLLVYRIQSRYYDQAVLELRKLKKAENAERKEKIVASAQSDKNSDDA